MKIHNDNDFVFVVSCLMSKNLMSNNLMKNSDVEFIRETHAKLRENFLQQDGDLDAVWKEHCSKSQVLKQYSNCMKNLATTKWDKESSGKNRIQWCVEICKDYFRNGGKEKYLAKDARRLEYFKENPKLFVQGPNPNQAEKVKEEEKGREEDDNEDEPKKKRKRSSSPVLTSSTTVTSSSSLSKVKLLDVGSCYNPFKEYCQLFQTLPIDLHPATKDVFQVDFLTVELMTGLAASNFQIPNPETTETSKKDELQQLPRGYFDVVAFCLLLTYIPCPHARWKMCKKAHQVLKSNGILLIITPDSNCVNKRARLNKLWREAIESIGFVRFHYSKSPHLHHFAFRKVSAQHVWDKRRSSSQQLEKLDIPQDHK